MIKLFLIIIAMVFLTVDANGAVVKGATNKVFTYTAVETGEHITIDLNRHRLVEGDVGLSMTLCEPTSKYICIWSKTFDFAVPRNAAELASKPGQVTVVPSTETTGEATSPPKSWVFEGQTYHLISSLGQQSIFGKPLEIAVIEAEHTDESGYWYIRYYYSPKLGLLGFLIDNTQNPKYTRFFVLDGTSGFGAQGSTTD